MARILSLKTYRPFSWGRHLAWAVLQDIPTNVGSRAAIQLALPVERWARRVTQLHAPPGIRLQLWVGGKPVAVHAGVVTAQLTASILLLPKEACTIEVLRDEANWACLPEEGGTVGVSGVDILPVL